MENKEAIKFLDTHAPGWKDADPALDFVKSATDPKVRTECKTALRIVMSSPVTSTKAPKKGTNSTTKK